MCWPLPAHLPSSARAMKYMLKVHVQVRHKLGSTYYCADAVLGVCQVCYLRATETSVARLRRMIERVHGPMGMHRRASCARATLGARISPFFCDWTLVLPFLHIAVTQKKVRWESSTDKIDTCGDGICAAGEDCLSTSDTRVPGAAINKTSKADRQELINQVLFRTYRWELMKIRPAFPVVVGPRSRVDQLTQHIKEQEVDQVLF